MKRILVGVIGLLVLMGQSINLSAWVEHPLMAHQVLSQIAGLRQKETIEARELKTFLIRNEKAIEKALNEMELWAVSHLPSYDPTPTAIRFEATGNPDDIVTRFLHAIRINPNMQLPLYLHLLPGEQPNGRPTIAPSALTTLSGVSEMEQTTYLKLLQGDMVSPLSVLVTANDEPDYGLDLGLYEDNNTDYGKMYGFGNQPFGNPNLEYSSQAPFHMGFYHEAGILFKFGAFLRKTYPEYRIQLFTTLSKLCFELGEEYWGYRFMGWGMHYLGDLSMPYHTAPLPGTSTLKMLWINLKAMLGFPKSKDQAVQLVSNKHTVFERFQWLELRKALHANDTLHPLIVALRNPVETIPYSSSFPAQVAAKGSVDVSKGVDKILRKWIPKRLIADPKFEAAGAPELEDLVGYIEKQSGKEATSALNEVMAQRFRHYSMHMLSFYDAVAADN